MASESRETMLRQTLTSLDSDKVQASSEPHGTRMPRALFELLMNKRQGVPSLPIQTRYMGNRCPATRRNASGAPWPSLGDSELSTSGWRSDGNHSTSVSTSSTPALA